MAQDVRIKSLSSTKVSIFRKGESILHCMLLKPARGSGKTWSKRWALPGSVLKRRHTQGGRVQHLPPPAPAQSKLEAGRRTQITKLCRDPLLNHGASTPTTTAAASTTPRPPAPALREPQQSGESFAACFFSLSLLAACLQIAGRMW